MKLPTCKIPPALGTNQIAGFGGFRPLASLEKIKVIYCYCYYNTIHYLRYNSTLLTIQYRITYNTVLNYLQHHTTYYLLLLTTTTYLILNTYLTTYYLLLLTTTTYLIQYYRHPYILLRHSSHQYIILHHTRGEILGEKSP